MYIYVHLSPSLSLSLYIYIYIYNPKPYGQQLLVCFCSWDRNNLEHTSSLYSGWWIDHRPRATNNSSAQCRPDMTGVYTYAYIIVIIITTLLYRGMSKQYPLTVSLESTSLSLSIHNPFPRGMRAPRSRSPDARPSFRRAGGAQTFRRLGLQAGRLRARFYF